MEVIELLDGHDDASSPPLARPHGLPLYAQWSIHRLSVDFPRVKMVDLRSAFKCHGGLLLPAYEAIALAYETAVRKEQKLPPPQGNKKVGNVKWLPCTGLKLMKMPRTIPADVPDAPCPVFEKEWSQLSALFLSCWNVKIDLEEPNLQCGCCCLDVPFQKMVQCADGHLFCFSCLRRRVEESIFGGLSACGPLPCMDMSGCESTIPWSELQRAIEADLLTKFEERQASDSVARAKLQGLVYCPVCDFACEVDEGIVVFKCPNKSCLKESCLKCKELAHLPLRCEEVEKPSDTNVRNQVEEIMSQTLIRECTSCKAKLIKEDGCNKIVCRCGQTMCYICREPIKDYRHFCEHVRDPGRSCMSCQKCSLWVQEDANMVVKNAKRAAIEFKAREDPNILTRAIGPDEIFFFNKRMRT